MKKGEKKDILKSLIDISGFINYVDTPELVLGLIIEECVLTTGARLGAVLSYNKAPALDALVEVE